LPVSIGDDRPDLPQNPNPLGLITRCGVADLFDFPLDPPHAETVSGGQDFGVYRQRYEGYHTGEDWWYSRRGSLGKPIYSIGNGRVRYAAPNGWGDDLGTLVIEHILPDGRRLYSFYGHLDPPSLTLRAGQCVGRGDQVGEIGDPRSSPHLHFEIRTIFADAPGPGYWSIDPGKSGWLPPSETIEFSRYHADERMQWWRSLDASSMRVLGWLSEQLLLQQELSELVVIDFETGEELARLALEGLGVVAAWDPNTSRIYVADLSGALHAQPLTLIGTFQEPIIQLDEPDWSLEQQGGVSVELIPMRSGVLALWRDTWAYYDEAGSLRWSIDPVGKMRNWVPISDQVIVLGTDQEGLWIVNEQGAQVWQVDLRGLLFEIDGQVFLYAQDGFYRLDLEERSVELLFSWHSAHLGQAVALRVGGSSILLTHADLYDQRLILIQADGQLILERSLANLNADRMITMECAGDHWLLTEEELNSSVKVGLHRINPAGELTELFRSYTRERFQSSSYLICSPDESALLLNLGGQRQLSIDLNSLLSP
jgi:murein DD-endopeptidase MepM/ murein hydrolase activator NlpD